MRWSSVMRWVARIATLVYGILILVPFILAFDRLIWAAGTTPAEWFSRLDTYYLSKGAIEFSFEQALVSVLFTTAIGLPIAWQLGRYRWPGQNIIRAVLTMPFVMPAIIAAMGFLSLSGPQFFDIRADPSTYFWTLIIAHAWFNMALVIRFTEPVLSTLDKDYEDQLKLLPGGKSFLARIRNLWFPVLRGPIAAAMTMTFVFSFTSFALIRWLTPLDENLETLMSGVGSSAGIQGYNVFANEIVLAASLIQFAVMLVSLWLLSFLQQRNKNTISQTSVSFAQGTNTKGWLIVAPGLIFAVSPLITVIVSSLRIPTREGGEIYYHWGTDAWSSAFAGSYSNSSVGDALLNSIGYASITMLIALPLGWILAKHIHNLELAGSRWARVVDVLTMLPFAISAVMIGLGVSLGIILIDKWLIRDFWIIPVIPHLMLTTPFVVRIMLNAQRNFDPAYVETGKVLGLSRPQIFYKIELPLLRPSILVSAVFTVAMSLGEFGASWIVARFGSWDTLPVLIDQLRSKPGFDPLIHPTAAAAATVLMITTFIIFVALEKFRGKDDGGMF